jgi:4-amino-4-deoxy-L-arabinose transferase-like glycosyltransferase
LRVTDPGLTGVPDERGRARSGAAWLEWLLVVGLPLVVGLVLLRAIDHDPARGVTFSNTPFSDEGWRAVNARNLVFFGSWTTDDWKIYLLQLPLSVIQAVVFKLAGVGLIQARLISVAATVAMTAVLVLGLRRPLGLAGALAAGAAVAFSALTLYYGRLALVEPVAALALSVAAIGTLEAGHGPVRRWAVVTGVAIAIAILLKATALPCAIGILAAAGIWSVREVAYRRFVVIAFCVAAIAAGAGLVFLARDPNGALATLPQGTTPSGIRAWVANILNFIRDGDGFVPLAWPLLVGGALSAIVVAFGRGRPAMPWSRPMSGPARVALIGFLWAALGVASVASFGYQPNRYSVQVLPGLALLIGAGGAVVAERLASRPISVRAGAILLIVAVLVLPGLVIDAGWVNSTGTKELRGQEAVAAILPPGAAVAGEYAPVLGMLARVPTIVLYAGTTLNGGDLYARGVRWGFVEPGPMPAWVGNHPAAWAARQERWCTDWGRLDARVCLVQLP